MSTTQQDPIEALRGAGVPVDQFPEEKRAVLAGLSPQEVATLVDIQQRLNAAGEVEGYAMAAKGDTNGYIFY